MVNAVAILHEERFLARIGWGQQSVYADYSQQGGEGSVKVKVIGLISAVRTLLRIPLIIVNTLTILYLFIFG
ncbi:Yos1-like protein [Catenaria anguillulae PL171]|uniref:Yos1-like protein n=1 Tax=Catenaria anguillulae PL171 TaxID=765915 RepID=A0A1Y2HCC3_9FUNG|nr:Yos1-like protein [Catenaria anguillulae PL171]